MLLVNLNTAQIETLHNMLTMGFTIKNLAGITSLNSWILIVTL